MSVRALRTSILVSALAFLIAIVLVVPMTMAGKSPHVRYAPSEIDVTFDDVKGLGPVKEEVVKTLNLRK
jgi:ABC-type transporter Mla subunit MlaD